MTNLRNVNHNGTNELCLFCIISRLLHEYKLVPIRYINCVYLNIQVAGSTLKKAILVLCKTIQYGS